MTIYVASFYSSVGRSPLSSRSSLSLHFLAGSFWALLFLCFSVTSSILHCFCFFSPFDLMSSKKQVMGAQTAREREICSIVWAVAWFHNSGHCGIFFSLNSGFRNQEDNYFYKEQWCKMSMS